MVEVLVDELEKRQQLASCRKEGAMMFAEMELEMSALSRTIIFAHHPVRGTRVSWTSGSWEGSPDAD
jgi:hypothetical protein